MANRSNIPTPEELPSLPRDEDGPVFREPWEAQAFAMTLKLYDGGHFTWPEWAECLALEITDAQDSGDPDLGDTYYLHWLKALERIVMQKGLLSEGDLVRRKNAWDKAAHATPHGEPILLPADG